MEILKNKETAETIRDGFLLDLYNHKEDSDFDNKAMQTPML